MQGNFAIFVTVMKQIRHIVQWANSNYRTSVGVTIALLTLWQLVIATFGVDLCDTGYYLMFFEQIFFVPESVEYNFMYYLNGLIGGTLNDLLPTGGKWMLMRIAGVLCNVGVMVILARTLRWVLPATAVILGYLMVTASLVQFPYTFNHDLMSALLWVIALVLMYRGLVDYSWDPWLELLLAGLVVGVNTFTRIPNVLALALAVMPFIAQLHDRQPMGFRWKQSGIFIVGALVGALFVILFMIMIGHWHIFVQNMSDLVGVATGRSGEATHNVGDMVAVMLRYYGQCLYVGLKIFALWLALWLSNRYIVNRWLLWTVRLIVAALALYLMWYQSHVLHPLWVMCVAGTLWVIVRCGGGRAIAAWLGLFMLLVFPLGGDGATNNGGIIAWMAAPVAALLWQRRDYCILPLAFIAVGMVQTVTVGAYFDGGPLWHKTATVQDERAAMIHTTPERARIINETLPELKKLVGENERMLCYGSIPMMNYLTHTIPAIGCAWPELLSAEALAARLNHPDVGRPAILRQKFNDLGPYWSEPTDDYLQAYPHQDKFLTQDKMDALNRFISEHNYHIVWQNKWFALYKEEIRQLTPEERLRRIILMGSVKLDVR